MRKIYLVKKNPELPADGNNWLVMTCRKVCNNKVEHLPQKRSRAEEAEKHSGQCVKSTCRSRCLDTD